MWHVLQGVPRKLLKEKEILHSSLTTVFKSTDYPYFFNFKQISKRQILHNNLQWKAAQNTTNHTSFQGPRGLSLVVHSTTARKACGPLQRTLQTIHVNSRRYKDTYSQILEDFKAKTARTTTTTKKET